MGSFLAILRHEERMLRGSAAGRWVAGLLGVLTVYGLFAGVAMAERHRRMQERLLERQEETIAAHLEVLRQSAPGGTREEVEAAVAEARRAATREAPAQPLFGASSPNAKGQVAVLPPAPLAPLAVGQTDLLPSLAGASEINRHRTAEDRYGYENPQRLAAGQLDLALVVIYLLPLLVLALAHDLLAAEKEGGTLALVLSNPVTLRNLLVGKVLPRALLLTGLPVGLTAAGLALTGVLTAPGVLAGLALWALLVAAWVLFWLAAAVAVNALGWGSAANATALVALYLALVVALPSFLHVLAASRHPVPPRMEAVLASRQDPPDFSEDTPRLAREWYARNPDLRTPERNETTIREGFATGFFLAQAEMDRRAEPAEARIEEALARQQRLAARLALLSPAVLVRETVNDLAGTGVVRHQRFRTQADRFRHEWRRFFGARIFQGDVLTPADYQAMPRFTYQEEPQAAVYRRVLAGLAGLALWGLAALTVARWALRRYSVSG